MKENEEGTTRKGKETGMPDEEDWLLEHDGQLQEWWPSAPREEVLASSKRPLVVCFDLEATGLSPGSRFIQLAAYCPRRRSSSTGPPRPASKQQCPECFNRYVLPDDAEAIEDTAMQKTGLRLGLSENGERALIDDRTGCVLETVSEVSALVDLIQWLRERMDAEKARDGVLLVSHGAVLLDVPLVIDAVRRRGLQSDFYSVVVGWCDTLAVFQGESRGQRGRELRQGQSGGRWFNTGLSLDSLHSEVVGKNQDGAGCRCGSGGGGGNDEHRADADARRLHQLLCSFYEVNKLSLAMAPTFARFCYTARCLRCITLWRRRRYDVHWQPMWDFIALSFPRETTNGRVTDKTKTKTETTKERTEAKPEATPENGPTAESRQTSRPVADKTSNHQLTNTSNHDLEETNDDMVETSNHEMGKTSSIDLTETPNHDLAKISGHDLEKTCDQDSEKMDNKPLRKIPGDHLKTEDQKVSKDLIVTISQTFQDVIIDSYQKPTKDAPAETSLKPSKKVPVKSSVPKSESQLPQEASLNHSVHSVQNSHGGDAEKTQSESHKKEQILNKDGLPRQGNANQRKPRKPELVSFVRQKIIVKNLIASGLTVTSLEEIWRRGGRSALAAHIRNMKQEYESYITDTSSASISQVVEHVAHAMQKRRAAETGSNAGTSGTAGPTGTRVFTARRMQNYFGSRSRGRRNNKKQAETSTSMKR